MNTYILSKFFFLVCLIGGAKFDAQNSQSGLIEFLDNYPGVDGLEKIIHYYYSLLLFHEFRKQLREERPPPRHQD